MADDKSDDGLPKPANNVKKATVVGASVGGAGATVITWLASEAERRYAVPSPVTAAILGAGFAFVARWAAKLLPND